MKKEKMEKEDRKERYEPHKDQVGTAGGGKDEIPDVSPLARQQPPKGGSEPREMKNEWGKPSGEGKMPSESFQDKMGKSLTK